jgi:hypothetical protein
MASCMRDVAQDPCRRNHLRSRHQNSLILMGRDGWMRLPTARQALGCKVYVGLSRVRWALALNRADTLSFYPFPTATLWPPFPASC